MAALQVSEEETSPPVTHPHYCAARLTHSECRRLRSTAISTSHNEPPQARSHCHHNRVYFQTTIMRGHEHSILHPHPHQYIFDLVQSQNDVLYTHLTALLTNGLDPFNTPILLYFIANGITLFLHTSTYHPHSLMGRPGVSPSAIFPRISAELPSWALQHDEYLGLKPPPKCAQEHSADTGLGEAVRVAKSSCWPA